MTAGPTRALLLELTVAQVPLRTLNDRESHWRQRSQVAAAVRQVVKAECRKVARGLTFTVPVIVDVSYLQVDRRRRDPDNIAPAVKPVIDGIVDAGILADDSWNEVAEIRSRVVPRAGRNGWLITVYPAPAGDPQENR